MKTIFKLALAIIFVSQIYLAGGQEVEIRKLRSEGVVGLWTNVVVNAGETAKEVFVLGGSAKIDGNVLQNVFVIRGNAEVNGEVGGDVVIVSGSGKIGDNARIGKNIVNVASVVSLSPKAQIGGSKIEVLVGKILPDIGWIIDYIRYGVFKLRLFAPQVKLCWGIALIGFVLNLILVLIFPKAVSACMETVKTRPVTSFAVGLLFSWILIPLLLVLLAATVVGIFVLPFFVFSAILASIFGKAAIYRFVGHQIGAIGGKDSVKSPVAALVIGTILLLLVYMLPIIGLLVWVAVSTLAFGAAVIAAIGGLRGERPPGPQKAEIQTPPQPASVVCPSVPPQYTSSGEKVTPETPQISGLETPPGQAQQQTAQETKQMEAQQQSFASTEQQRDQQTPARQVVDYKLLPRVGFWRRFVATLIDFCVFIIPIAIFHGFAWVLWFAYHLLLWRWNGATIGDLIMGIRIVKETGEELDWKTSMIRALAGILSAIALFIGFFWAGWSRDKKAWHDYIAGTIVVKTSRGIF